MNTIYEQTKTRSTRQRAITKENYQRHFLRDKPGREPGVNDNFFNLLEMATEDALSFDNLPTHFIYSHATTRSEAVDCVHVYNKPVDDIDNVIGKLKCYNFFEPSVGYVVSDSPSDCRNSEPPVDVDENGEVRLINGSLVRVIKEGLGEKAQFDKVLVFAGGGDLNENEVYVKRKFTQRLKYTSRSLPIVWGTCSPDMDTEVEALLCDAVEQDWYSLKKPTYYQNRCEYWINVPMGYEYSQFSITDSNNLPTKEAYQKGIRELFEFYNKNRSNQFLSDIIFNCYMFGEVRSLFPTTTGTNALIVVPARYFHAVPSDTDSVSEFLRRFSGQVANQITFRTNEISQKIDEVSDAMLEYNFDKKWLSDEGYVMGPAFYGVFSFNREVSRLKEFVPTMVRMFRTNGVVFRRNNSDKVTIGLNQESEILYVLVEQDRFVIPMVIGAKYYSKTEPLRHKRTVGILSNIDNIIFDINYTQSIPYKEFVKKYISPEPELNFQKRPGARKCKGSNSSPFNLNRFFCCLERNFRTSLPNPFGDFMDDQIKGFFDGYKDYESNILSAQSCGNSPYDLVTSAVESTHRLILNQVPKLYNKYVDEDGERVKALEGEENDSFGLGVIFDGAFLDNKINSTFFGKRFSPIKSQIASLEEDLTINDLAPFVNECTTYDSQEIVDPYIKELVMKFVPSVQSAVGIGDSEGSTGEESENLQNNWDEVSEVFSRIDLNYFLKKAMTCACSILEREAAPSMYDPRLDSFSTIGGYSEGSEEQNAIRKYFNEFNLRQGPYGSENNLLGIDPTGTTAIGQGPSAENVDASFGFGQNIGDSELVTDNRTILPTDWNVARATEGALDAFGVDTPSEAAVAHQLVCKDLCKSLPVLCSCIDLTIPDLSTVVPIIDFAADFSITGIFGYIADLLIETLINIVLDILFGYLRRIIEDLLNCEFEKSDPDSQNSFNSLMNRATNGTEGRTAEEYGIPIGDRELLKPYIDDVPLVINPAEMCGLLKGEGTRATLNTLEDLMLSQHLALRAYLPDKDAIQELFTILGSNVNVDAICVNLGMITDSTYTRSVQNICDTLGISELRRNLERGNTSPEVIADLLEEARNCRAKRILALSELTRGISEDPQSFLKRIIPQMLAAPGKDGLIPRDPPELIRLIENAIDGIFNSFAFSFDKEVNSFVDSLIQKKDNPDVGSLLGDGLANNLGDVFESFVDSADVPSIIMGNLEDDLSEEDNFKKSTTEKLGYSVTFDLDMKPFDVDVIDTSKTGNISTLLQGNSFSKINIDPKIEYNLPLSFQCVGEDRQRDFYEVKISERVIDRDLSVTNESFVLSGEDYLPECAKIELSGYEIKGDYSLQQELFSNSIMKQWKANFDLSEDQQGFLRNYFASESFVNVTEEAIKALAKTLSESRLLKEDELGKLKLSGDLSCFPPKDSLINVSTIKEEIKDNYYGDTSVDDHKERFNLAMVDGAVKSLIKVTIFEFLISGIIPLSRFKMEDIMSDVFVKMSTKVLLDYIDSRGASPLADKNMSPIAFAEFRELLQESGVSNQRYIDGLEEWSSSFKGEFLRWAKSSVLREIQNREKLYDPFTKERIFVDFEKFYKNQSVIGRRDEERLLITDYYLTLRDWYDSYFVFQANLDARNPSERESYDTISNRGSTGLSIANNGLLQFELENFSGLVWFEGAEEEGLFDITSIEGVRRFEQLRYDIFFLFEDMLKSMLPDDPDNQSRDNINALTLMAGTSGAAGELGISDPLFIIKSYSNGEDKFFNLVRNIESSTDNKFLLMNGILYNGVDTSGTIQEGNRERARRILNFFEEVAYEYKCECIPISNDVIEGVGNNRETFKVIGYLEYLVKQQMESMRFDIESMLGTEIQSLEELFFGISDPTYIADTSLGRFDDDDRREFSEDVIDIPFYQLGELENNPFNASEIADFNSGLENVTEKIKNKQRLPIVIERYFTIEEKDPLFWYNFGLKRYGSDEYDRDILGELASTTPEETEYLYSYFAPPSRTFATRYNFQSNEKSYTVSFRVFTEWLAKLRELQNPGNERLLNYVFDPPPGDSDELFCAEDREDKFFFKFKNFFENISIGIRLKYFDAKNNIEDATINEEDKRDVFDETKSFEYVDDSEDSKIENIYSVVLARREEKLNYNDFIVRPGTLSLEESVDYGLRDAQELSGPHPFIIRPGRVTGINSWINDSAPFDEYYSNFYETRYDNEGKLGLSLNSATYSNIDIKNIIEQVASMVTNNLSRETYFSLLVDYNEQIRSNSLSNEIENKISNFETKISEFSNNVLGASHTWTTQDLKSKRLEIAEYLQQDNTNPERFYNILISSIVFRSLMTMGEQDEFNSEFCKFKVNVLEEDLDGTPFVFDTTREGGYLVRYLTSRVSQDSNARVNWDAYLKSRQINFTNEDFVSLTFYDVRYDWLPVMDYDAYERFYVNGERSGYYWGPNRLGALVEQTIQYEPYGGQSGDFRLNIGNYPEIRTKFSDPSGAPLLSNRKITNILNDYQEGIINITNDLLLNPEQGSSTYRLTEEIPLENFLIFLDNVSDSGESQALKSMIEKAYSETRIIEVEQFWNILGRIEPNISFYYYNSTSQVTPEEVSDALNYREVIPASEAISEDRMLDSLLTWSEHQSELAKRKFYCGIKMKITFKWRPKINNGFVSVSDSVLSEYGDNADDVLFFKSASIRGPKMQEIRSSRSNNVTSQRTLREVFIGEDQDSLFDYTDIRNNYNLFGTNTGYGPVEVFRPPLRDLTSKAIHDDKMLKLFFKLDELCNNNLIPEIGEMYEGMDNDFKLNHYDYLLNGLKKQCDYKFLSEYVFPVKRLNSLVALYSMQKVYGITREKQLFAETKYNSELILYLTLLSNQDDWWSLNAADAVMSGNLGKIPDWFKFLSELPKYDFSLQAFISFIPRRLMQVLFGIPWFSYLLDGLCRLISLTYEGWPGRSCEQLLGSTFTETIEEPALEKADADCGTPAQVEERRRKAKQKAEGRLNTSGLGDTESPYAE